MKWLWRISEHPDLSGLGGEKALARWHTAAPGKRVVYLAEHPAVCLMEALVNLKGNPNFFPSSFRLMKVNVDESASIVHLPDGALPEDWRSEPLRTRALGDAWLDNGGSALLAVPSAPSPESVNYLLNPRHPDSRGLAIAWGKQIGYDKQLFRTTDTVQVQTK